MKVYLVYSGSYDDVSVDQVFSTRELAEQYIALTDQPDDYSDMPGWSFVTWDLQPHLRIVEVEVDKMLSVMNSQNNLYIGNMDINGEITFIYRKFNEISDWSENEYHIVAAYKNEHGKYHDYHKNCTPTKYTPSNYLLFKVMAENKSHVIDIVNSKRLELIDKGMFTNQVTEDFIYIGGKREDGN